MEQSNKNKASHIPRMEKPQTDGEHPISASQLSDMSEAELNHLLEKILEAKQQKQQAAAEENAQKPTLVTPDPACFDAALEEEEQMSPPPAPAEPADTDTGLSLSVEPELQAADEDLTGNPPTEASADAEDDEDIAPFVNQVRKRRRRQRMTVLLISICSLVLLLFILAVGYLTLYKPTVDHTLPFSPGGSTVETETDEYGQIITIVPEDDDPSIIVSGDYERKEDVYNFLVMGIDRAANLADVVMLINYDVKEGSISVLQLPRDTYINVGSNYHKLNAYFYASYNHSQSKGEERYKDAVESFAAFLEKGLCIQIDRYICMDTAGFRDIVDAIGGVYMDVPFDMDYEDPEQDLYIHLDAGYQLLDGEKAEEFVRFRKAYINGDIGRISAQKLFLTALIQQVKENLSVSTVVSIAKTALTYVTTDLTPAECGYFVKSAFSLDLSQIAFTTLPGDGVTNPTTKASYYVMYAENVRSIINEQFNVYTKEISSDVFFNNSTAFTSSESYVSSVFRSQIDDAGTVSADQINKDSVDIPIH